MNNVSGSELYKIPGIWKVLLNLRKSYSFNIIQYIRINANHRHKTKTHTAFSLLRLPITSDINLLLYNYSNISIFCITAKLNFNQGTK